MLLRTLDRKVTNSATKSGNARIRNTFGLTAGESCPGATKYCESICYAGKTEKMYKNVLRIVSSNLDQLQNATHPQMISLLSEMVADFEAECDRIDAPKYFRIHWDGDFFSLQYANAWATVCRAYPDIRFWVYTRSFNFVPALIGIDNLVVYLSSDENNYLDAAICSKQYGLPIAHVSDTMAEAVTYVNGYKCPENDRHRLPLISEKGSACMRCGICPNGRGNVLFARSKK